MLCLHSHFLLNEIPHICAGVFTPHFILSAQAIAEWFATLCFTTIPVSSCRGRLGLAWALFTHRRFLPWRAFTDILTCVCVYRGFSRGSSSLGFAGLHSYSSDCGPRPSVSLIHSHPQTSYQERFSFKFYHILAWIACGESLIYLLLTRIELFSFVQSHM